MAHDDVLDNEESLFRCLEVYKSARDQDLDMRNVICEKCGAPIVDFDLTRVLSNTRVCQHCNHTMVVGSNVACTPLATLARPRISYVAINQTTLEKVTRAVCAELEGCKEAG